MGFREEQKKQKEKTSQELIKAALTLSSEEGYASLSLRSVARKAGIAPTSFYRHYRDMDELGIAIIERANDKLVKWMDLSVKTIKNPEIKKDMSPAQCLKAFEIIIKPFVGSFMELLEKNNNLFYLFFHEKNGSSKSLRDAISMKIQLLTDKLNENFENNDVKKQSLLKDTKFIAETFMMILSCNGLEMLSETEPKCAMTTQRVVQMAGLIFLANSMLA